MKNWVLLLGGCLYCFTMLAQTTLIKNVTVIDVVKGKAVTEQSVLINNGKIEQVGPAKKIQMPANAVAIDGTGKFLMPGMTDAHIHFFQSGSLYTRPDAIDLTKKHPYELELAFAKNNARDYMKRYLRLGITSIIDVGGPFSNFSIRDSASRQPAPDVLVTGPLFSMVAVDNLGNDKPIVKIASKAQADSLLQKMLPFKPDFIKIWYIAGPDMPAEKNFELVQYIAQQSHANKLKLAVHATELNTAELAVKAGADILVHSIDDAIVPDDFVKTLKQKNIAYIPTMIVGSNYYKAFSGKLSHHPQDLQFANAFAYGTLTDPESFSETEIHPVLKYLRKAGIPTSSFIADSIAAINLKKLNDAGVNISTGTDAGNIGTQHAASYLQELEAMQAAGLSNIDLLKASTINPAIAFGRANETGSIDIGKKADLILLDKNPLESIHHLQTISLLMKNGVTFEPDSLINESAEAIVQRQLNAYNARNLEAFLDTYSDDVELYSFPAKLESKGKEGMRKDYGSMFTSLTNLYCQIESRIVQGNVVIDKEKVRIGKNYVYAIAIYEVNKGKISKVTFIQ
jgi:imidazolonepropionase-like amidohydrolase